jgi:GT2 family glycosyltransferase
MPEHNAWPKVSVVILNYNGLHFLERFLGGVEASSYPNLRIIVADNASTDGSVAYLQAKGYTPQQIGSTARLTYIVNAENEGFAGGYNRALAQVDTEGYWVLLNSDVEVPEHWIEPVIAMMVKDPQIGIAQPKLLMQDRKSHFEYAGAAGGWMDSLGYPFCRGRILEQLEADEGQYNDAQEIFWASGACMFIRAGIFQKFGGFDGDFFAHMEEIDLCWRVKRAGYKVMYCPDAQVYHVGGGTLHKSNPRKTFLNFRNSLSTILKNETGVKTLGIILTRMVLDGLAAGVYLLKGEGRNFGAVFRAHMSFYAHLGVNLKKRKAFKQLLQSEGISPTASRHEHGVYKGSIIWAHFVGRVKTFNTLIKR